ncbi:hypothetical protein GCM10027589_40400 [Actinocorallia lasiicapitis]
MAKCMKGFGFTLTPPSYPPIVTTQNAAALGWLGEYQVERYGYAGRPGIKESMDSVASEGSVSYLVPESMTAVFYGDVPTHHGKPVPQGGCLEQANAQLNDGAPAIDLSDSQVPVIPDRAVAMFRQQILTKIESDASVRSAVQQWRDCMKRSGLTYATPVEAASDPQWNREDAPLHSTAASPEERRVATADDACRITINYSGHLYGAALRAETPIIHKNLTTLESVKELHRIRLANAERIERDLTRK